MEALRHRGRRVLLLNPPGDRPYLRDYYCSSISKSGYYWHPIDLLVLSGSLSRRGMSVAAVDAIAESLPEEACLERIRRWRPDVLIFLTSASSWPGDRGFLGRVAGSLGVRMIGCGEVFLGETKDLFAGHAWLEAGIRDFTDPGIPAYVEEGAPCHGVIERDAGGASRAGRPGPDPRGDAPLDYGVPLHGLFPLRAYRYPWHRHHPFATLLTAYGCPFRCKFCNSGSLGYRLRTLAGIEAELQAIRAMGIRQLFVKDMSFAGNRDHAVAFCHLLCGNGAPLSWNCYARLVSLDPPLLEAMRAAGCHLVQVGVETAHEAVARSMGKPVDREHARGVFHACRRLGIRTGAHFILGLPGETERGIRETIALARDLGPDYCSFNLFIPRHGSALGPLLSSGGGAAGGNAGSACGELDPSEAFPVRTYCEVPPERLFRWRIRAYRAFYARPAFLLRQTTRLRTRTELAGTLRDAWGLAAGLARQGIVRARTRWREA